MDPNTRQALRHAVARMEEGDRALGDELRAVREAGRASTSRAAADPFLESVDQEPGGTPAIGTRGLDLETIVLRVGRPVLAVVEHRARLDFRDSESEVWRDRLQSAAGHLERAARAVGRINVVGHPHLQWVGTGWLIDDSTIVTNRHVAREFGRRGAARFEFASFAGAAIRASIDFLEEVDRQDRLEFRIVEVLHIEDDDGPDVAFLRVEQGAGGPGLATPIALAERGVSQGDHVAVIGYPARDSRVPDFNLMQSIFGDVYDRKRLAPGQILDTLPGVIQHDCSTLGGNSGSVVLDLAQGRAVGLHFAGRFLQANWAVPASAVADCLAAVRRSGAVHAGGGGVAAAPAGPGLQQGKLSGSPPDDPGGPEVFVEGVAADYVDRRGYEPDFIGVPVPLPRVVRRDDVLTFPWNNAVEQVLAYEHFSVVMSRSRRLCLLSAVNIDGGKVRRAKRSAWRIDPRISSDQQIRNECYGNAPKFSRGHMTRRTDPVWGTPEQAARANADSMHVTNTVPQLQPFNAGIWLGLEDYALDHAVEDAMRVSVFTGPFLAEDDPVRYGVPVPRSFWKVIAFIHDETGELSATGYVMSQASLLVEEEFVFGQHQTSQVAIEAIERQAGLSFGTLAEGDPFVEVEEGVAAPLTDFSQITFRRQ